MSAPSLATPWRGIVRCAVVALTSLIACVPAQGRTVVELRATTPEKDQSVAANAVWTYESKAFAAMPPLRGSCAAGLQPLYRSYNNGARGDPNHRYSTNPTALQGMAGWTFEGLVMCVPSGETLTLPPALAGCGGACPAGTTLGNGLGLVNVVVQVVNTSAAPLEFAIPRGQTFVSASPTVQSGIALETLSAMVAPSTTSTFVLALFCLNADLSPSNTGATYAPGPVTTEFALLELASMSDGRLGAASDPMGLKRLALQNAVWEINDGSGALTVTQKKLLAMILGMPGDDPAIDALIEQFLESLP